MPAEHESNNLTVVRSARSEAGLLKVCGFQSRVTTIQVSLFVDYDGKSALHGKTKSREIFRSNALFPAFTQNLYVPLMAKC